MTRYDRDDPLELVNLAVRGYSPTAEQGAALTRLKAKLRQVERDRLQPL